MKLVELRNWAIKSAGFLVVLFALVSVAQWMGITSRSGFRFLVTLLSLGCVALLVVPELFRPKSGGGKHKQPPLP